VRMAVSVERMRRCIGGWVGSRPCEECLMVEHPKLNVSVRLAEQDGLIYLDLADEFWRCIEIGANGWRILDAAAHGVRMLPHVRLRRLPRMADFALWATACESAFRPAGTLETAYYNNRRDAIENIIDAEPVAAMCASSWPTERNGREAHPTFSRSASILAAML
jgi:hypothetical protein